MDLKQSMDITFMNNAAWKITGYETKALIGSKVNLLMPEIISDTHSKFIKRFLKAGKSKVIN